MDKIVIRDLHLRTIIGTFPGERTQKQELLLNIELGCDLQPAAMSDDLKDTIDYKAVKLAVLSHAENAQYKLIETLAENVARICLEHEGVKTVKVSVDKPGALRFARSVAVEIERERAG